MSIVMSSNNHNQKTFSTASISQFLSSVSSPSSSTSSSQICTASSPTNFSKETCDGNHGEVSYMQVGFSPLSQESPPKCKESKVSPESSTRSSKSGLNLSGCTPAVVIGKNWLLLGVLVVLLVLDRPHQVFSSEFPERECCDPVYPVATSTSAPVPSAITVPAGGKTGKTF